MPVNGTRPHQRYSTGFVPVTNGFNHVDTSFLLDDNEDSHLSVNDNLRSPVAQAFAQLGGDDTFPTLTSDGLKVRILHASSNLSDVSLAFLRSPVL